MATGLFTAFKVAGAVGSALSARAQGMAAAAQDELNAKLAKTQALQRDTLSREDLLQAESATAAARAANGLSGVSPNAIAIFTERRRVSDRDRQIDRADGEQRAANYRAAARARRRGARVSLFTGLTKAAVPLVQYGHYKGYF